MKEYQYAIIIPAWNEAEFIEASVAAALAAMASATFTGQLIVVDNNSTDATAELARNAGAQVVFEPINQISRARNAGAAAAEASMFVFVDADSYLEYPLLQHALDLLHGGDVVGGGAYIRADREVPSTVQRGIASWNWFSSTAKLAAGCFVYCRSDAFVEVGGFSVKRFAGEELVLSRALRKWGRKRDMQFRIIREFTMQTSMRKMDWYSNRQLFKQAVMVMLPGALGSKRFMRTWYDESTRRSRNDDSGN